MNNFHHIVSLQVEIERIQVLLDAITSERLPNTPAANELIASSVAAAGQIIGNLQAIGLLAKAKPNLTFLYAFREYDREEGSSCRMFHASGTLDEALAYLDRINWQERSGYWHLSIAERQPKAKVKTLQEINAEHRDRRVSEISDADRALVSLKPPPASSRDADTFSILELENVSHIEASNEDLPPAIVFEDGSTLIQVEGDWLLGEQRQ